jgi:Spy/CpxP family protein refolding chaperone
MSRKALIIIIGISVGLNVGFLGTLVYQHFHSQKPFPERPDVFPELIDIGIDLSPEQKGEIAEIMKGNQDMLFDLREDIRAKKQELFFLMNQEEPDIESIEEVVDEIARLQADMEKQIVLTMLSVRGILTPEQTEILNSHMGGHLCPGFPERRFQRRGWRGGRGK